MGLYLDNFQFDICVKERPITRRGILSVIFLLFDPLGFVSPVILSARRLFQELCRKKLGWDEIISPNDAMKWNCWVQSINVLSELSIPRLLFLYDWDCSSIKSIQVHHFVDASVIAYGVVTYVRCESEKVVCFSA